MKRFLTATVLCFFLAACGNLTPTISPSELSIEAYALSEPPQEEWTQLPFVDTTEGDPRLKHEDERSQSFPDASCIQEDQYGFCAMLGSDQLFAREDWSEPASGLVLVTRNGEEIYRIPIGEASPVPTLRGLWVYDNHWVIETVFVNTASSSWAVGQITMDGELLNDQYGYEEAFGLQTIKGKPFYFIKKDGKINANYDGVEITLGYDEIPHYNCCMASSLNPMIAQIMVAFFAREGSNWYYVEMGAFDQQ